MSGDGGNGGGNGGSGDLAQQLADANAKISELSKTNEELGGAKESLERQLGDANKELLGEDYLEYLESKKGGGGNKGGQDDSAFSGGADFDQASNTEVAKFVVKHMDGKLKEIVENFGKNTKALDDKIGLAFARLDVTMTAAKYDGSDGGPSWAENEKEICKIAKENPSWGAEQCYKQFKLEHAAKVKEDADKAAAKAKEEEDLITEKGGVPGSTTEGKDLTAEEAAEIAYRKAYGNKKSDE